MLSISPAEFQVESKWPDPFREGSTKALRVGCSYIGLGRFRWLTGKAVKLVVNGFSRSLLQRFNAGKAKTLRPSLQIDVLRGDEDIHQYFTYGKRNLAHLPFICK